MSLIDADVRAVIESAHLCFAATVGEDGTPNLSPKGTIRVHDDEHLYFLDIASPQTRANLRHNPTIAINIVETTSRRGYRFLGQATLHDHDDALYSKLTKRVFGEEGVEYPATCVVLVRVEQLAPLVSPGYMHIESEAEMRATWKARRAALDAEFEKHLTAHPFTPPGR